MARKEPRKTTGGAKGGQSAKKSVSEQGPVGAESGRQTESVRTQDDKPSTAPTRTLTHDQVAERARRIWQERGCPHGEDERNWREAEKQLKHELGLE